MRTGKVAFSGSEQELKEKFGLTLQDLRDIYEKETGKQAPR
jgi:hypothetical protein